MLGAGRFEGVHEGHRLAPVLFHQPHRGPLEQPAELLVGLEGALADEAEGQGSDQEGGGHDHPREQALRQAPGPE